MTPLTPELLTESDDRKSFNALIEQYHYLGYRQPFGRHLCYFIVDRHHRRLGSLLFEAATTTLNCRDDWIGWDPVARSRRLSRVVNNSRFLISPWVRVDNLASKGLAMVMRQLSDDWEQRYGERPVLLETFVDETRFNATTVRAANWQKVGLTKGVKATPKNPGKSPKAVYLYPLTRNCQSLLKDGPPRVKRRPPSPKRVLSTDAPFVR